MTSVELEAEKKLVVALDVSDADRAYSIWRTLDLPNAICKIGLELIYADGARLIRRLADEGVRVFVDAKLHDIGNTVERATAQIASLGAAFVTVHAQDGKTLAAAVRGRGTSSLKLLGVTVLTDLGADAIAAEGTPLTVEELVLHRAALAAEASFDGVISSPVEVKAIKARFDGRLLVICPGIRPEREQVAGVDDQVRVATPGRAIGNGADYLVVGRPIVQAPDPAAAARAIIADIAEVLGSAVTPPPMS